MGWYTSAPLLVALVPLSIVTLDILHRILRHHIERKGCPLPPGPVPLPLLGSALSVNHQKPWLTYTKWQEEYGDIIYVQLVDTDVIVLNSFAVATELMEKRSRIYSDRPFIPTIVPYGNDCNFSVLHRAENWRLCRRIFHQTFNANASLNFRPMQLQRARRMICNIIDDSAEFRSHFLTFAAAIAMSAVYDYEPQSRNDPMVSLVYNYIGTAFRGLAPEKILLVKSFPFLLYVPDWLPGSWIRREAQEARAWRDKMVETPYQYVRKRMESEERMNASMVSDHVVRIENLDVSCRTDYETALKYAAATAFLGSSETTSTILATFTLAMVQNPHIWKRAQASIDAVVGTDRLPDFDDRPSLPYIEAIMRETIRWRPVSPMLFPHSVSESDIYKGYFIPKGATIIGNAWAMSRNKTQYPDAEMFIPERFLDMEGKLSDDDPMDFIFGFGRRRCPGRYVADASVWSGMVTMLATLDFHPAKDADGNDIAFKATFTNGIVEHPDPFPCQLTPRSHVSKVFVA